MKTSKTMTNPEIAETLRAVAGAYRLKDENKYKFQIIAYERAAESVDHATSELKDLWEEGKLNEVAGIGSSIQEHLDEIFKTGKSKHFEDLTKDIPPIVFELMKVPGVGVKTSMKLVEKLGVKSFKDIKEAASKNKIAALDGFGEDSQARIVKAIIDFEKKAPARMLLPFANEIAESLIAWMHESQDVVKIDPLGSLRRFVSTIGDIDLSVATNDPIKTIKHFCDYPKASRVLEKGERSAAIVLPGNIRVDLIATTPASYGSLLQHFTGGKNHNVALREYALKQGISLSDYGIYTTPGDKTTLKEVASEKDFYEKYLKMDWIPPELREDNGEIKAAIDHTLPNLVRLQDIKGDLHIHSDFDIETSHDVGMSSMKDLVKKANDLNYEYIALTEHNPSRSKHNESEVVEILKRKREKVDQLNSSLKSMPNNRVKKVFNSLEIDIMPDGKLPVSSAGLDTLDFALVSVHSSFTLPKNIMTQRVLTAFEYPKVKVFAHPTARLLNNREGIDLDWEKIFEGCIKKHIILEINADPARLDLPDTLVHEAIKRGILLSIDTDSHHIDSMDNMKWGVSVARRGWCEAKNIVNVLTLSDFESRLLHNES